jgi:hypothetical protein
LPFEQFRIWDHPPSIWLYKRSKEEIVSCRFHKKTLQSEFELLLLTCFFANLWA